MKINFSAAIAAVLLLASCQSSQSGKMEWVQFQPGDVFEVADAKCRMMANTQQQGLYAQGTPGFVAGAQLGNAIGNAIRMEQFYKQCMTISGWKQQPVAKARPVVRTKAIQSSFSASCLPSSNSGNMGDIASVRHVSFDGHQLSLGGVFKGQALPRRTVPCTAVPSGLFCQVPFENIVVTATLSGSKLTETATDPVKGVQLGSATFQCDKPFS